MRKNNTPSVFLYGKHACIAAMLNKNRKIIQLFVSKNTLESLPKLPLPAQMNIIQTREFDNVFPGARETPHQGIILEVQPLESASLNSISGAQIIVALDQVTDPHNVGAIMRSCAAFGVGGLLFPKDNATPETGALAKAASGALEIIPVCKVTNLARTLDVLKKEGFWVAGLDGHTNITLDKANISGKTVLVLGAEGKGLRKLTREHCDVLVRLPISDAIESLNVSNAAAIALYQIQRNNASA